MNSTRKTTSRNLKVGVLGAVALAIAAAAGTPAAAGTCPAGQATTNADHGMMTEPKGVTDTVVSAIDLGKEPIAINGRMFRLRRLEIQPGGVVPFHSHAERPAIIYVQKGEVTEYSTTCKTPLVHRAGEATPELHTASHWWRNTGREPAVLISADLLKVGDDAKMM